MDELRVYGVKCNNCGNIFMGELDASVLFPKFWKKKYFVVKNIKRALLIDKKNFKCNCGGAGYSAYTSILLLSIIPKEGLKKYFGSLKKNFEKIKEKIKYYQTTI